jgi:hypothetical protein
VVDIVSAIACIVIGSLLQPALDYNKKRNLKKEGEKRYAP